MESNNKLGKAIGIVKTTCKTTVGGKGGEEVRNLIYIDFSTASDTDIKTWLCSNRVIAGQRPWKAMSEEELTELDGTTFIAQSIGTKVKTKAEQIQTLVSAGLSEKLARFKLDSPEKFQAAIDKYEAALEESE